MVFLHLMKTKKIGLLPWSPMRLARSGLVRRGGFIPRNAGFTLVEMLVVIAIMLILARILLPVIENARAAAMGAKCASNMRQLGVAFYLYAEDWKYYPYTGEETTAPSRNWAQDLGAVPPGTGVAYGGSPGLGSNRACQNYSLAKYANRSKRPCRQSVYWCPMDGRLAGGGIHAGNLSYMMNGRLNTNLTVSFYPLSPVKPLEVNGVAHPAATYLLFEGPIYENFNSRSTGVANINNGNAYTCSGVLTDYVTRRHHGGSNALFCDGHVKWIRSGASSGMQLGTGNYDVKNNRGCAYDAVSCASTPKCDATTN